MKAGKITQTMYRRSVFKQLHTDQTLSLLCPAPEENCYGIRTTGEEQTILSSVSLCGNEKDLLVIAMAKAANDLAAKGARVKGVGMEVLLPDFAFESRLKTMMALAKTAADREGITILEANAQVMPALQTTIVHVNAVGSIHPSNIKQCQMAKADQDIVLMKWVGLEGTIRIKNEKEEELKERFIPVFLNKIDADKEELFSMSAMETAAAAGVSAMHQIGDGGILAALWEMAESADVGLDVDMRKIAVKQETIEVCEYYHLNPYQMTSTGAVLLVTDYGEELADALNRNQIEAALIGRTTKKKERVLQNRGEKRYLERPAQDEFARFFSELYIK